MSPETLDHVVRVAGEISPDLVDITGGSPELHPDFREFIVRLRVDGHAVQSRTNLTVLEEIGLEETIAFFKSQQVRLIASLPCYLEENVNRQRGRNAYASSLRVLQSLNKAGYGLDRELPLNLVYNPGGPVLPPNQSQLEQSYKQELNSRFGIRFNDLLTLTNMPIGRFWAKLKREEKDKEYMQLLFNGFNCRTVDNLMCRHQINVGWDGTLYDCDFNLALRLPLQQDLPRNIRDFDLKRLEERKIVTGKHCFGCTAGFGSSCGGALAETAD